MQQKQFTPKSSYAISRRHLLDSRLFSFCDVFFLLLLNTQRTLLVASVVMTSHPNVFVPVGPSNTSHGSDANGTGVWWMQTLDVADSMVVICGTWFWKKLHRSRAFSWLCPTLNERLLHQELRGERGNGVSYMHQFARCLALHWGSIVDDEFSLNGIRGVSGVDDEEPALLHYLPKRLHTLTFASHFSDFIVWEYQAGKVYFLDAASIRAWTMAHRSFNQGPQRLTVTKRQALKVCWPCRVVQALIKRTSQSVRFLRRELGQRTWPADLQSLMLDTISMEHTSSAGWPEGLQSFLIDFIKRVQNWPCWLKWRAQGRVDWKLVFATSRCCITCWHFLNA